MNALSRRKRVGNRGRGTKDRKLTFKMPSIKLFVVLGSIFLLVIALYTVGLRFNSYNAVNIDNSLSKTASERLLIAREDIESTLFVFEAPLDNRILAAWVVIRNTKNGSTMVYYVPSGVYVRDYSGKLDEYVSVSDLRYAGNALSETRDIEYAIWQISNLTGLTIDSYIWVDPEGVKEYSNLFGDLSEFSASKYQLKYADSPETSNSTFLLNSFLDRFSLFGLLVQYDKWEELSNGVRSNLAVTQLIPKLTVIKGLLNSGGVVLFDLSQSWAIDMITTSNDKSVNVIDYVEVDDRFSENLGIIRSREIEREQAKVEVYNASGIAGLASRYARKIQNAGITVVRYENAPAEADRSVMYVPKPEKYPSSLGMVKKLIVVDAQEITGRPSFITTGDIVVVLGKDMEKEANWQ